MPKGSTTSWITHIREATGYTRDGLRAVYQEEVAFRLVLFETIVLAPLALWLGPTWVEKVLLCLPLCLCLVVELINSAIENTVDLITLSFHPLAKKAKDMGSAAQGLAQLFLLLVWLSFGLRWL